MISNLYILGTRVMPFDNAGAGFQMTGRSAQGNAYNPTQAGDCAQYASQTIFVDASWSGSNLGIPSSNGLLFSVAPRNYNEPVTCLGQGPILPFNFEFGATLGDGITLPKEIMVVDMYYTRWSGSEIIQKDISEAPTIFPFLHIFPLAYWSSDGSSIQPFLVNGSNDMRSWSNNVNHYRVGKIVMACTTTLSNCISLYSNKPTNLIMSKRPGASHQLSLLTLTVDTSGVIDDYNEHHIRTLLAVGTPSTITAAISQAQSVISDWGNL